MKIGTGKVTQKLFSLASTPLFMGTGHRFASQKYSIIS